MATARKKHVSRAYSLIKHRSLPKTGIRRIYKNSVSAIKHNPYKSSLVTLGLSVLSGMLIWYRLKR